MGLELEHTFLKVDCIRLFFSELNIVLFRLGTVVFMGFRFVFELLVWKGVWGLAEYPCAGKTESNCRLIVSGSMAGGGLALLFVSQCLRSATCPPFGIRVDCAESFFDIPTYFKSKVNSQ